MLRIITGLARSQHGELLAQMHRDRKRVFVDRLGWNIPVLEGEFEIDQFDGQAAVYLIATDELGRHAGSLRLLPTAGPHLLSEVFPQLCERGVPRGPDVWEITRLCTAPDLADARPVRRDLMLGVIEFAILHGITRYTCMTHVPYLSAVLAAGWDCEPLGLPQEDGGVMVGALAINMTPETLSLMRDRTGVRTSVLALEARNAA